MEPSSAAAAWQFVKYIIANILVRLMPPQIYVRGARQDICGNLCAYRESRLACMFLLCWLILPSFAGLRSEYAGALLGLISSLAVRPEGRADFASAARRSSSARSPIFAGSTRKPHIPLPHRGEPELHLSARGHHHAVAGSRG